MTKVYAGVRTQKKANELLYTVWNHALTKGYWSGDEIKQKFKIGYGTVCAIADMLEERGSLIRTSATHRYYRVVDENDGTLEIESTAVGALPPVLDLEIPAEEPKLASKKDYRCEYLKLKFNLSDDDLLHIMEVLGVEL